ncbi:MAG: DUF1549 and DUF1553 domain-containing protein [Planctomyces sp.]
MMLLAGNQHLARFVSTVLMLTVMGLHTSALPCSAAENFTAEKTESADSAWAFNPLKAVAIPEPARKDSPDEWSGTPVDRFVLNELALHGLEPAPDASPEVLIRRLYFDLLGLPPSPDEVEVFLHEVNSQQAANSQVAGSPRDAFAFAWSRLVDRLLEDPRYGEHWARFWLDLVRYAESDGWNQDAWRPHIWRYRDYVIRSFNSDKPWAQFVREQLSGDEMLVNTGRLDPLAEKTSIDQPDCLTALGFLRLGVYEYNQRDARGHWNDIMNETTDVVGDVFLGVSIACARCHDHKFDPISQKDYFRLRAFFEPVVWRDDQNAFTEQERIEYEKQQQVWLDATQVIRARLDAFEKPWRDKKWISTVDKFPEEIQQCFHRPVNEKTSLDHQLSYLISRQFLEEGGGPFKGLPKPDQEKHAALMKELAAFDAIRPLPIPLLMTVSEIPDAAVHPTMIPDDPERKAVEPGFLEGLRSFTDESGAAEMSPGRRSQLADWITHPQNPLTNRVIVNRIWQQHFGSGLVATPNDFGSAGGPPSNPELLDWLALRFCENGGSFKSMHRLILNSRTWMQSADHPRAAEHLVRDPEEKLHWRHRIRRLRAEEIRDSMLAVSDELQTERGGVSVASESQRRAVYLRVFRNVPDELLGNFDSANGLQSCPERTSTTTPVQALFMMNSDFTQKRAESLAELVHRESSGVVALNDERAKGAESADAVTIKRAVRASWRKVLGRDPSASQVELICRDVASWHSVASATDSRPTISDAGTEAGRNGPPVWLVDLCHVLLNSSEFLYID